MNEQEISKLAREYAEDYMRTNAPEVSLSDNLTNEIEKQVKPVLQWLLRDHCIVKKSEVKEVYQKNILSTPSMQQNAYQIGIIDTLEHFFGTDLFKERSEE